MGGGADHGGVSGIVLPMVKWGGIGLIILSILLAAHFAMWHFLGERIYEYRRDRLVDALVEANPGLGRSEARMEGFANPWKWLVERDAEKRRELRETMGMFPGVQALSTRAWTLVDLTPLSGTRLELLALDHTQATDLTPLAGLPLRWLVLNGTPVTDLSPLAGMPLQWLSLHDTRANDLTPLAGMPLRGLCLGSTRVSDLSPLAGMPLEELELYRTQVTDLSPLQGMPLKLLDIRETPAAELPLPGWLPPTCEVLCDPVP